MTNDVTVPDDPREKGCNAREVRDWRHRQSCHFAVRFAKLAIVLRFQPIRGRIVPKLSEYVKVTESAEMPEVSRIMVWISDADGKILMCRNPASGYSLLMKRDVDAFLKLIKRLVKTNKQT